MTAKKSKKTREKLILLDAHAILHRAYHALPDFTSSNGEPTGALYGFTAFLIKVLRDLEPDHLVACYDLPGPTFRHEEFEDYKGKRKKPDGALVTQINRSKEILKAFNVPVYEIPGFEADDIIGTISQKCGKNGVEVVIASGDMDTLQLADEKNIRIYTLRKGIQDTVVYDKKAVEERFGFSPQHLPDFKGLSGDQSDNIPGIPGIGVKTATELIQVFGSLENIYKELKKNELIFEEKGIKPRTVKLLKEHEEEAMFSKALGTIRLDAPVDFTFPKQTFWNALDKEKADECFDEFEFRTLKARFDGILGQRSGEESSLEETKEEDIDSKCLQRVKIALWILNSELTTPELNDIYEFTGIKDFKKAEEKLLAQIKEEGLQNVYDLEVSIISIVEKAQNRGILVDTEYFEKLSQDYHQKLSKYEQKIWKLAGEEFNINSPKQLAETLFDHMKISTKGIKKTAGGAISTRESELEKLGGEYKIIDEILGYRELQKLLSTYIDNIPKMLDENHRLHTSLNQTGTTTGRMSSTNPNLQNIPVREGLGEAVRNGFVAENGFVLAAFDYSQIEMRVLAELSGDESLLETFRNKKDVHSSVASRVFEVAESEVTKDMRRKAKVINFGIVYGMGVRALRQNLGGTMEEAQKFYDAYFQKFPQISKYFENIKQQARKKGYTETYFGRRRYFPEISSSVPYIRSSAERMAVNAPVQGTATGDLVKIAMKKVEENLKKSGLENDVHLLLQVHDELIYEIKKDKLKKAAEVIQSSMEKAGDLSVPLEVEVKTGERWGDLKKYPPKT